jgi:hypothetical protein
MFLGTGYEAFCMRLLGYCNSWQVGGQQEGMQYNNEAA